VLRDRVAHLRRHAQTPADPGRVDAVLVSHSHHDHLDRPSLRRLAGARTTAVVPAGAAGLLRRMGYGELREVTAGDSVDVAGTTVRVVEAWHDGRRRPGAKPAATVGYLADRVWFAGDTDRVLDEIESFLTGQRSATPSNRVLSTVLFTDIVGSTERATQLGDMAWTTALAAHNRVVERHVAGARGAVVKFTGDGALATFDGPARAINCACAIRDALDDLGLPIRTGLHTGEVEMADGDVHGIAVHIAARIMALAAPGEVLVSGAIPPLVLGSRIAFDDRGSYELKGVPDRWPVLAVRETRG